MKMKILGGQTITKAVQLNEKKNPHLLGSIKYVSNDWYSQRMRLYKTKLDVQTLKTKKFSSLE